MKASPIDKIPVLNFRSNENEQSKPEITEKKLIKYLSSIIVQKVENKKNKVKHICHSNN
jgi:hypothetical protein